MCSVYVFNVICLFTVFTITMTEGVWARSPSRDKERNEAQGNCSGRFTNSKDFEDREEDDDDEFVDVSVPKKLKNKNYNVVFGDEVHHINGKNLKVKNNFSERRIRLATEDHRTVAFDSDYITKYSLDSLRNRPWRVSVLLGSIEYGADDWGYLPLDNVSSESWFEVAYKFSALGAFTSYSNNKLQTKKGFIEASLKEEKYTLGMSYEFVPTSNLESMLSYLHINLLAGLSVSQYRVAISDGFVTLKDDLNAAPGVMVGGSISIPVIRNFWIDVRSMMYYQQLKLKELDLNLRKIQYHYLLGGAYAF